MTRVGDIITVSAAEARSELDRLLEEVERGATVRIFRDGASAAQLTKAEPAPRRRTLEPVDPRLKVTWHVPPEKLSDPDDFPIEW